MHSWVCIRITSFNARLIHFIRIFLYPSDISLKLLRLSTLCFGYNPRLCFSAARSVNVSKRKMAVAMSGIRDISGDILQLLCSTRWGDSDISHSVFEISPRNERRLLAQCGFGAVSLWALDVLLTECEIRRADADRDLLPLYFKNALCNVAPGSCVQEAGVETLGQSS